MKEQTDGLTRRDWLKRAALLGAGAAFSGAGCRDIQHQVNRLTGPTPADWTPLPQNAPGVSQAVHVLNRAGFGPRPGDVARTVQMGASGWLEEQIADDEKVMGEDPAATWRVNSLDIHQIEQDDPNELYCQDDHQLVRETGQAALLRATYSRHQLREVMADFWTNHFNIYALKLEGRSLVPTDTERILRPNTLGDFETMLKASAHSPAMLTYLDNKENKSGVANENYARELLELHTLGVKSGYTIRDIQAVARCFTGWTVGQVTKRAEFEYHPELHDPGAKYIPFLHLTIAPNGQQKDADTVLTTLARHPVTARFLASKLCRRFLGCTPPDIVEKAANAYLTSSSGSSIRALIRPILLDGLLSPSNCRPVVKRPLDLAASALRCLAADSDCGEAMLKHLSDMGQPLYQWPMPDGFPEKSSSWTGTLLPRWNFAIALASNAIPGTRVDLQAPLTAAKAEGSEARLNTLMETVFARPHTDPELAQVKQQLLAHLQRAEQAGVHEEAITAEVAALLLASPEFQGKG